MNRSNTILIITFKILHFKNKLLKPLTVVIISFNLITKYQGLTLNWTWVKRLENNQVTGNNEIKFNEFKII